MRDTRLGHADHGARPGVEPTKTLKVARGIARQYHEIALDEARSEAGSRSPQPSGARCQPDVASVHDTNALPRVSGSRNAAMAMRLYAIVAKIAIALDNGIVAEM